MIDGNNGRVSPFKLKVKQKFEFAIQIKPDIGHEKRPEVNLSSANDRIDKLNIMRILLFQFDCNTWKSPFARLESQKRKLCDKSHNYLKTGRATNVLSLHSGFPQTKRASE